MNCLKIRLSILPALFLALFAPAAFAAPADPTYECFLIQLTHQGKTLADHFEKSTQIPVPTSESGSLDTPIFDNGEIKVSVQIANSSGSLLLNTYVRSAQGERIAETSALSKDPKAPPFLQTLGVSFAAAGTTLNLECSRTE